MKSEISDQIEKIGLENIAQALHATPKKAAVKFEHPEKFKLSELMVLQELGFTDKMILLMLRN